MDTKTYGGVTAKDVIVFQTKIMMGAQFGRIVWAREHKAENIENSQNEILIACLRIGWNDAFRHTSENEAGINDTKGSKGAVSTYTKKDKYKMPLLRLLLGKITSCTIGADFDDYFSDRVISKKAFLDIFKEYAITATNKETIITSHWAAIQSLFKGVKKLTGSKALSLGHIQKMFNIALKLYLCLFMCREYLNINVDLFYSEIIDNLATADCPIDSIILKKLSEKTRNRKFAEYKWSKFGTEKCSIDYYEETQKEISKWTNGSSNLYFDFSEWEK